MPSLLQLTCLLPQACSSPDCPSTAAVLLADVDGDGWPDVVVGNDGDPNVLLRNNGHGGFAPPVDLPGSPNAYTRALALAPLSSHAAGSEKQGTMVEVGLARRKGIRELF